MSQFFSATPSNAVDSYIQFFCVRRDSREVNHNLDGLFFWFIAYFVIVKLVDRFNFDNNSSTAAQSFKTV